MYTLFKILIVIGLTLWIYDGIILVKNWIKDFIKNINNPL